MVPEFNCEQQGYSRQEVEEYIENIRNDYQYVVRICKQLQERREELEQSLAGQEETARTLITAQSYAQTIMREAEVCADQMMSKAREKAEEMIECAQEHADQVIEEVEHRVCEPTTMANAEASPIMLIAEGGDAYDAYAVWWEEQEAQ